MATKTEHVTYLVPLVIVFHIRVSRRLLKYWYLGGIMPLLSGLGCLAFGLPKGQIQFAARFEIGLYFHH